MQSHTTQQKLFSLGLLVDAFVFPLVVDKHCFDRHLDFTSSRFVKDVDGMKFLQGALTLLHFSEYLHVAGIMADIPDPGINAQNSQKFLDMCPGSLSWGQCPVLVCPATAEKRRRNDCPPAFQDQESAGFNTLPQHTNSTR